MLLDPAGVAKKADGIDPLPVTVVIDQKGRIRLRIEGATTAIVMPGRISSLLEETKKIYNF